MRAFNRIVMILLLAGLFVLGVYTVVYSLNLFGYRLTDLPRALGVSGLYRGLETFVGNVENGSLTVLAVALLVSIAIVGLILLIAELKPACAEASSHGERHVRNPRRCGRRGGRGGRADARRPGDLIAREGEKEGGGASRPRSQGEARC